MPRTMFCRAVRCGKRLWYLERASRSGASPGEAASRSRPSERRLRWPASEGLRSVWAKRGLPTPGRSPPPRTALRMGLPASRMRRSGYSSWQSSTMSLGPPEEDVGKGRGDQHENESDRGELPEAVGSGPFTQSQVGAGSGKSRPNSAMTPKTTKRARRSSQIRPQAAAAAGASPRSRGGRSLDPVRSACARSARRRPSRAAR